MNVTKVTLPLFFQNECDEGNIALEVDDENTCCILLCYIDYIKVVISLTSRNKLVIVMNIIVY